MKELEDTEIPSFTDAPSEEESEGLTNLGRELAQVSEEVQEVEEKLSVLKKKQHDLRFKKLPDYMRRIKQDVVGLPEFGVDVTLEPFYYANIPADWEEKKRQEAFEYLDELGGSDLVKKTIKFQFGRGEEELAEWFLEKINKAVRKTAKGNQIPQPEVRDEIPWNTLTGFVRRRVEAGEPVEPEKLNGQIGYQVKLKKRK